MSGDSQKRAAGEAAAALVRDGMTVGLGTGSTAAHFVRALGARAAGENLKLRCLATSEATAALAREVGLTIAELGPVSRIDLTVDGADEIGPGLSLIKGGGAALLREKLVWEASRRCVVIADAAKSVAILGKFPLPIEVVAFGHQTTLARICDVLTDFDIGVAPRLRTRDGQPVLTDGGNVIYDANCGEIHEASRLGEALKLVTGVVEHGLFLDLADEALIGGEQGVQRLLP
ncbi:MAG: ribose-5-phosphate isomerase RpiA [Caulobacteraceae bacterium]